MNIIKWFKRVFRILTIEECKELGLEFSHNVHGDNINNLNCRSIWKDEKGRTYKCGSLGQTPVCMGTLDLWAEKLKNEFRQERENQRLISKAKREAFQMYLQWNNNKLLDLLWKKQYPNYIMSPYMGLGMWVSIGPGIIYHYPNDKVQPLTSEEYNKIRNDEFERLKTLYSP
jgi:hypothetical protein